jgi:hypothetical protein|tara:strand:- start:2235 stop:2801 length:567 start_codon:yes stop_codon:yes gene_type:complete
MSKTKEMQLLREEAIFHVENTWANLLEDAFRNSLATKIEDVEYLEHNMEIMKALWYASTEILPHLEMQYAIDSNNNIFVSTGTGGFVDFKRFEQLDGGMKLPLKCWVHTHPFGSAYFSGTDINTVAKWKSVLECAYVLGGEEHYGFWCKDEPDKLEIWNNLEVVRTQLWGNALSIAGLNINQLEREEE